MMTLEQQVQHYKAVRARITSGIMKPKTKYVSVVFELPPIIEPEPEPIAEPVIPPLPRSSDPRVNILRDCAHEYGCTLQELMSASRKTRIMLARRKAMYLLWQRGTMSKAHIGRFLNKDHTTVIHAIRSYEKSLAKRGEASECVQVCPAQEGEAGQAQNDEQREESQWIPVSHANIP